MAIGKNVTQIAPRYEFASADRKLSLPACEEADLQHVGEPIQSKPFLYLMPLRVAILHQDCMNIDMQLVNRSGWRRPSEHDEKVGEVASLRAGVRLVAQEEEDAGDSTGEKTDPSSK